MLSGASAQFVEALGQGLELGGVRQAVGHGLVGEGRSGHALGPETAPPRPGLGVGEGPGGGGDLEVREAGGTHPRGQEPTGIGLGVVAGGDLVVQLEPAGEPLVGRRPHEPP